MLPRERLDAFACSLEALAKSGRLDTEGFGCIRRRELQELSEDVRETVGPIEALEHAERAPDLDLFGEHRALRIGRTVRGLSVGEVVAKLLECQPLALDRALLDVEDESLTGRVTDDLWADRDSNPGPTD